MPRRQRSHRRVGSTDTAVARQASGVPNPSGIRRRHCGQGLSAATGSAPKTTSKTAITPAEKPKPLTNVVRGSGKAVPESAADPVATVDKPTKDGQETIASEPAQPGATSNQSKKNPRSAAGGGGS